MTEEYDEEIFTNNPDVTVNDRVIMFQDQDGTKDALGSGRAIKVGDPIVLHHTNTGDLVTHGKTVLKPGDKVIIVQGQDGDLYGLKEGKNPYRDCPLIHHSTASHFEQHDPPDDTWQYASFDIHLERPIEPHEYMNIRFDFELGGEQLGGVQPWYPYGGVWIGFGPDPKHYYWPAGDPYRVIRGQPAVVLGPNGYMTLVGTLTGGAAWCIEDFLGRLYPWGIHDFDVEYIHIHMSQQSSLFFRNYLDSRLVHTTICVGDLRDGWCDSLNSF